ncbi:MAG TPA: hypothetical protein VN397_02610, partial [Candidatus Methylomirabilis sp.]|nr:hypothetical protein [Candidatus Methylomirabilis sp.]
PAKGNLSAGPHADERPSPKAPPIHMKPTCYMVSNDPPPPAWLIRSPKQENEKVPPCVEIPFPERASLGYFFPSMR